MGNEFERKGTFSLKAMSLPYGIAFAAAILSLTAGLLFTYVFENDSVAKGCEFVFAIALGISFEFLLLLAIKKRSENMKGSFLIWGAAVLVAVLYFITGVDVQYNDSPLRFLSVTPSTGYIVFFAWFLNYKLKVQKEREYFTDDDLILIFRWSYIAIGIGAGIGLAAQLLIKDITLVTLLGYLLWVVYCIYRLVKYLSKKE